MLVCCPSESCGSKRAHPRRRTFHLPIIRLSNFKASTARILIVRGRLQSWGCMFERGEMLFACGVHRPGQRNSSSSLSASEHHSHGKVNSRHVEQSCALGIANKAD